MLFKGGGSRHARGNDWLDPGRDLVPGAFLALALAYAAMSPAAWRVCCPPSAGCKQQHRVKHGAQGAGTQYGVCTLLHACASGMSLHHLGPSVMPKACNEGMTYKALHMRSFVFHTDQVTQGALHNALGATAHQATPSALKSPSTFCLLCAPLCCLGEGCTTQRYGTLD